MGVCMHVCMKGHGNIGVGMRTLQQAEMLDAAGSLCAGKAWLIFDTDRCTWCAVMLGKMLEVIDSGAMLARANPQVAERLHHVCHRLAAAMQRVFQQLDAFISTSPKEEKALKELDGTVEQLWRTMQDELQVGLCR